MILKILITLIFVGTSVLKLTGKVAPDWNRWGFPRQFMYATGIDRGDGIFHGWTFRGILWSTLAGAVGALGAFTLIMALGAGTAGEPSLKA